MNTWMGTLAADLSGDSLKLIIIGTFVTGGILLYKLLHVIGSTLRTRELEQSRRELSAYVAEGSMTAETADRLLSVGRADDWHGRVAEMVEAGRIDSHEAEKLLKAGPPAAAAAARGT